MKAIIYFSLSKNKNSKKIASSIEGNLFELVNLEKHYKTAFMNMFIYGFKTVRNKDVRFQAPDIDFDKFEEVVLVSPVWAGKANIFMKKYLETIPFKNKEVTIIGSCDGGYKNYFSSFDGLIDSSNKIVDKQIYVKGEKVL